MPELVHSELTATQHARMLRLMNDALLLKNTMTRAQIRGVYQSMEAVRDALSTMLDKADGKDA